MSSAIRRLAFLLVALLVALATGFARPDLARADDDEGGRSGDNAAIAINTKSGSSLFKFAFSIRQVAGDVVDQTNAAIAYSSCESCKTTAIAIQIVLVSGSPSVVTPQNLALALNENCTLCETFAGAYQIVLGTGGPVEFTGEGRRRIAEIKLAIRRLRDEDLSPPELKARLDTLVAELKDVLETELRPVSRDGGEDDNADDDADVDDDEQFTDDDRLEEPPQTQTTTGPTETTTTSTTTTTTTGPAPTDTTATTTSTTTTESPTTTTP